ncbi:AAA family ATPase, partial [Clostridium butyricum]
INGFLLKKDDEILSIDKMSTGEKMLFFRLFFILAKIDDDSLIILEEPEIHLNYSLIKQLITIINLCFDEFNVHFLISSHNPVFINMLFPDNILVFEKNTINHPNINTFLANERELSRCLFGSSRMKNYIETEILEILKSNNVTLIEELMQNLGESYIKYLTFKRLKELGEINVEGN